VAGAAVAVIVDDRLVIQLCDTDVETSGPMRPQANRRSNDPIPGCKDWWQRKSNRRSRDLGSRSTDTPATTQAEPK
jgi:hypothetical protein